MDSMEQFLPGLGDRAPLITSYGSKRCNCKKARCLKLYCVCFAAGVYCNACACRECQNTLECSDLVMFERQKILQRSPRAFAPKVETKGDGEFAVHKKGCRCRKSKCLKKYCECFDAGVFCCASCRCEECHNLPEGGVGGPGIIPHVRDPTSPMCAEERELAAFTSGEHGLPQLPPLGMASSISNHEHPQLQRAGSVYGNGGGGLRWLSSAEPGTTGDEDETDEGGDAQPGDHANILGQAAMQAKEMLEVQLPAHDMGSQAPQQLEAVQSTNAASQQQHALRRASSELAGMPAIPGAQGLPGGSGFQAQAGSAGAQLDPTAAAAVATATGSLQRTTSATNMAFVGPNGPPSSGMGGDASAVVTTVDPAAKAAAAAELQQQQAQAAVQQQPTPQAQAQQPPQAAQPQLAQQPQQAAAAAPAGAEVLPQLQSMPSGMIMAVSAGPAQVPVQATVGGSTLQAASGSLMARQPSVPQPGTQQALSQALAPRPQTTYAARSTSPGPQQQQGLLMPQSSLQQQQLSQPGQSQGQGLGLGLGMGGQYYGLPDLMRPDVLLADPENARQLAFQVGLDSNHQLAALKAARFLRTIIEIGSKSTGRSLAPWQQDGLDPMATSGPSTAHDGYRLGTEPDKWSQQQAAAPPTGGILLPSVCATRHPPTHAPATGGMKRSSSGTMRLLHGGSYRFPAAAPVRQNSGGKADSDGMPAASRTGASGLKQDGDRATEDKQQGAEGPTPEGGSEAGGDGLPLALRRGQRIKRPNTLLSDLSDRESEGKRMRPAVPHIAAPIPHVMNNKPVKHTRSWISDGAESDGGGMFREISGPQLSGQRMLIPHGHAVSPMNKMLDDMRGAGAGGARRAHSNRNGSTLSSGWHGTSPRESPRAAPGPKKASGTLDTLNSANEMEALQALFDLRSAGTVC